MTLSWTIKGLMATQTDQNSLSGSQYWLSCCADVRHSWITEFPSSMRPSMPLPFSLFEPYGAPADITLLTQPQRLWNAGSVSDPNGLVYWVSTLSVWSVFYKAVLHMCSTYFQPKLKIHTERRNQRLSKERQNWREDSKELQGREVGSCGSTYICSHRPTNSRVDTPDTLAL